MPRLNGGIIGPVNNPSTSSAKGVWPLTAAYLAQRAGNWPPTLFPDPYFENTTLLLPGNGTNGAQNNTFLDSSTNAFTITRNGNTTQGTFSPFSQTGWGNYCSGTTDSFSVASNATLSFGTGDFTIEFWIFRTGTNEDIVFEGRSTEPQIVPHVQINPSGYALFYVNGAARITGTTVLSQNTWYHVAVARSGTNTKLFVNGTQEGSTYSDSNNYTIASTVFIGRDYSGSANAYLQGYLSNLRAVKGTAVYTSNFTPPTSALTAISGTSLLMSQSNRFVDNSTNAFAITVYGSPSVQAFSPFNPTASWSAETYGGSGYFDGSGDYLTAPDDAFWDLSAGTGSIELFVYPSAAPTNTPGLVGQCPTTANWASYVYSDGRVAVGIQGTSELSAAAGSLIVAAWNHIVITRDNSTGRTRLFVNGVLKATGTGTYFNNSSAALHIGYFNNYAFNGYIADVRFCKGSIPTTYQTSSTTIDAAIFTPPSSPVTTSSQGATAADTELLLSYTNAGIYDATSKNDLETIGNAQISTTQSKFGGSSILFDGTGDYLLFVNSENFAMRTGDWTVEGWIYPTAVTTNNRFFIDTRSAGGTGGIGLYLTQTNANLTFTDGTNSISGGAVSLNAWSHVAVARYGSTVTLYLNGVATGTALTSYSGNLTSNRCFVGTGFDLASTIFYTGNLQDLRITKGIARYTANFTPPTAAFPTF